MDSTINIEAFICTWKGHHQNARAIELSIANHAAVRVINTDQSVRDLYPHWVHLDSSAYFSAQWNRMLELFQGDVLFQIQADTKFLRFDELFASAQNAFKQWPVGIYEPNVDYTSVTYDTTKLVSVAPSIYQVSVTDSTCWFVDGAVISDLARVDAESNCYGWGIAGVVAALSERSERLCLRDYNFTIEHPKSRGYDSAAALEQKTQYLNSQPDELRDRALTLYAKRKLLAEATTAGLAQSSVPMDQRLGSVRIIQINPSTYFTVWTNNGGFTDILSQFWALFKLGRSLDFLYLHRSLRSPVRVSGAFEFVGLNQHFSANSAHPPFSRFRFLDIPITQEIIENLDLSSFEKLRRHVQRLVLKTRAQTGDDFVVRLGIGEGGRNIYPTIHNGCKNFTDEISFLDLYRQARSLAPRASRFRLNKRKVLVHMRQGDTAAIETPWHTFISTWSNVWPKEYLQEFESYDQLSKDHIEIQHFYDFMQAFQSQFVDELSIHFCSDGYQAAFDCLFENIAQFTFDDQRIEALRAISHSYGERHFRQFDNFDDSVLQVGETDEHFFDLINSIVESDIIVTGTQQHMVVQFVAKFYDLGKPKIIVVLHRHGMLPDREWHDLSENKAVLIPVDVADYNIEAVCHRVRHELEKCKLDQSFIEQSRN